LITSVSAIPATTKGLRTRRRILDAARRVFARDGYVDARMSDVAAEAGTSNGGLYRYFANKQELFAALIADLHTQLYEASGSTDAAFGKDPYESLLQANTGYLTTYWENRDVMRAFIQAAAVEPRFQQIWWEMRQRHVKRFAKAIKSVYSVSRVAGVPVEVATDAMACMVEQCAYVWFAHEDLNTRRIKARDAAQIVTHAWYATHFPDGPRRPA
jgi:AcrR family transcriptional regulator